jgi:hypothetical protein
MTMLNIDTSLFEPIKIGVNGTAYPVVRLNRKVQLEIVALDRAWAAGDLDVPYKRLTLLLGEHPEFDELDISEVNRITEDIIRKAYGPPGKKDVEDLKNAAEPGAKA